MKAIMLTSKNTHVAVFSSLETKKRKSFDYELAKPLLGGKAKGEMIAKKEQRQTKSRVKPLLFSITPYFVIAAIWVVFLTIRLLTGANQPHVVIIWKNVQASHIQSVPNYHYEEEMFGRFSIAERSYEEVRKTWSQDDEISRELEVVQLPHDFSSDFHPESFEEFAALASNVIEKSLASYVPKNSSYAIVSICIGIDYCDLSTPNHELYASKHGYDYLLVSKNVPGIHPKMVKYLLLAWAINRGYDWMLMLDADALFTNHDLSIKHLLNDFNPSPQTNLILTRGGNWRDLHLINNGVFLLRNSEWSLRHVYQIFRSRWSFTKFLGKTLMDQPVQLSLLLAAGELEWPPKIEEERSVHVLIVPKKRMNSFRRDKKFYNQDVLEGCQWEHGDWIAHFASGNKYSLMIDMLDKLNMPTPPVPERFPFPLEDGHHVNETQSGSCWCSGNSLKCIPRNHVIGVHKAGTKALVNYINAHPELSMPYIEDPAYWMMDTVSNKAASLCSAKRKKRDTESGNVQKAAFLGKNGDRSVKTCSYDDYALLYGNHIQGAGKKGKSCNSVQMGTSEHKTLFDELNIWDSTFMKVRGVPLPRLMKLMQSSMNILISVRDPAEVVYSSYHHFGNFEVEKGPDHFHKFIKNMTTVWTNNQCHPSNYRSCLADDDISGSWLARAMYAPYMREWLSHFNCSNLFVFDVSSDPKAEVQRLYNFFDASDIDNKIAENATTAVYELKDNRKATEEFGEMRYQNPMNKASYTPMGDAIRKHLNRFFAPYNLELCELIRDFESLNNELFKRLCREGRKLVPSLRLKSNTLIS